jgi:Phosphotransferase enzyme family
MTSVRDGALPHLGLLLDPEAMRPVLSQSLGREARLERVRIARVSYKPAERACVHYEVVVDGRAEDVVARAVAGHDLEARARQPRLVELARRIEGRVPAATPLVYEPDADALLTWLPLDPRLPALAELPGELARRLRIRPTKARRLAYKPGRRAVLRLDGHVLKLYGSPRQYEAAAAALRAGSAVLGVATPTPGPAVAPLRLTAQAAIGGVPVTSLDAAGEAGTLLRGLHGARISGLAPGGQLEAATRKAALISSIAPGLTRQVVSLVRRLGRTEPPAGRLVPTHGDFHAGQLLRANTGLVVVDLDGLCLGPPALDLAEYAAAAIDQGGSETAVAVLDALVDGYGERPDGLDWHLATAILIRASHPFHKQLPEWPERTERMVGIADEVLGR